MSEQSGTTDSSGGLNGDAGLAIGPALRRRRRVLRQLAVCVLVLVPWTVYLGLSLPDQFEARHWRVVWVGFDVLLLLSLVGAGVSVWLRRQTVIPLSFVAATLLVCDAWFDITLDWGTPDLWWSIASAALVELPLAALLLLRARRVLRISVRLAWQRLGLAGDPPPLHKLPLFITLAMPPSAEPPGSGRYGRPQPG
jgi:hypothetical protein